MPNKGGLADEQTCQEFAAFISSLEYTDRQQAADKFGISTKTVTKWSRDPRVLVIARELRLQNEEQTVRKISNELVRRINSKKAIEEMDVKTLLDIRKQVLGPNGGQEDDDTIDNADIIAMLEDNVDLAKAMTKALNPRTKKLPPDATE